MNIIDFRETILDKTIKNCPDKFKKGFYMYGDPRKKLSEIQLCLLRMHIGKEL